MTAALTVGLDQVDFADLHRFWPEGVGDGARQWLLENITAGTARNGHVDVRLAATPDFSSVDLTHASGTLDGDGLAGALAAPGPTDRQWQGAVAHRRSRHAGHRRAPADSSDQA